MIHKLKIQQQYLDNLLDGRKKAEVRMNDRDYQAGDILEFDMTNPMRDEEHPPNTIGFRVTHIHSGLGLQPGYVVLSLKRTSYYG